MNRYLNLQAQPSAKAAMCAARILVPLDEDHGRPSTAREHADFAHYLAACADHVIARAGLDGSDHAHLLYAGASAHAAVASALASVDTQP